MSAKDCITAKAAAGKVNKDKAARLVQLYDDLEAEARGSVGPNAAADKAAVEAEIALARQTRRKKRNTLKQMRAQAQILSRAQAHPENVAKAMLSVLDFDPRGQIAGPNVSIMAQINRGRAHAHMVDFIEQFRSKKAGFTRRKAGSRAIVRELFGESTSDLEAKALAAGIREGLEFQRLAFNAAGGDIPKRKNWGLPQTHNRRAIAAGTKDDWTDFVFSRLDREQMIDLDTGLPMSETKLARVLADTYDNIVSDGMIDLKPAGFMRSGIIKRRQESRFLIFRNADAWIEYEERFGDADVFTLIMGHTELMARDTALIQVMGPQPEATLQFMENVVDQSKAVEAVAETGPKAARAAGRVGLPKRALRDTFNVLNGRTNQPVNQTWANVSAANRNILISAMLGGAWFSALADRTFTNITSRMNGIPPVRTLARHLKLFAPGSLKDEKQAVRLGFGAQGWASMAIAQERYVGEVIGPEWSKRLADISVRLSLLSPWTQAGRWGFMTEMTGFITEQAGKAFGDLPEALQRSFARYGITAPDWDLIRKTNLWRDPETSAEFLRPQDIIGNLDATQADTELFRQHFDVANKLQSAILTESEFAIPSTTARVKAILTGGTQPGTLWGEITRNTVLFKSFPVTLIHTHLQRAIGQQGGIQKGKYIAHLIIGTAIMGALGEQLSQIAKGRDPISMDGNTEIGRAFWLRALMRGGGLGIFGDFLFSDVNRFGGGILNTLAGPVFGTQIPAATRLTVGNLQELVKEGEAKNVGRELTRFVKLMTPGRSLWYGQLAMERLIFDEMQKMVDPNANEAFRRIERRARSERGQRFFSRPGRGVRPQRTPELERVAGN